MEDDNKDVQASKSDEAPHFLSIFEDHVDQQQEIMEANLCLCTGGGQCTTN